jgi:hypothetical protein
MFDRRFEINKCGFRVDNAGVHFRVCVRDADNKCQEGKIRAFLPNGFTVINLSLEEKK